LRGQGRNRFVISLVRDPVQRNVSAFFENLTQVIPDAYDRITDDRMTIAELTEAFLDRYEHSAPLTWFQSQLEPVFGIDVFATTFDTEKGYLTYEADMTKLLVIRLENLTSCGSAAIGAFLGIEGFELAPANRACRKRYGTLYAEFQRAVRLPESYLTRMHDSTFARHFYTATEIDAFRRRWATSV